MIPKSRRTGWLQVAGTQGILAPFFGFTLIGAAVASYPQFSWVKNALSDLGVVPGVTSILFNFGLCLSGLFFFIFSVGLFTFFGDRALGKLSSAIFVLTSLSLIGIGVFPENVRPFHLIFSVAFFAFMPLALLTAAGNLTIGRKKRMAVFTLSVGVVAALPWMLLPLVHYVSGAAITELVSALAGAAWIIAIGYKMHKISRSEESLAHNS